MKIEAARMEKAVVIKVSGRMDAVTAPEFEQACDQWIQGDQKNLVLDLGALDYISSAGLRSVLSTGKKVKAVGGKLLLCSLSGMVKEVFEISGFASIFPLYETAESALAQV
jgi:anti-anti-sigma factor